MHLQQDWDCACTSFLRQHLWKSAPDKFVVLAQELIQDPVVAMDGLTYERWAILDWFQERPAGFSYLSKRKLPSKLLLPNKDYKGLVVQLAN